MIDRKAKVITLSAIIVAMLLLSIGFAIFSTSLFIHSGATVNPNSSNFVVKFSKATSYYLSGSVTPTTTGGATGTNATISNTTASNLNAVFTDPGQTVTYQFYAVNTGRFDAYLRSISFINAAGGNSFKKCTPGTDANGIMTNPEFVSDSCASIRVTVTAGSLSTTTTDTSITNHKVSKNGYEVVTVVLEYVSGGAVADGPFTVEFGNIVFNYQTIDGGVETPVETGLSYEQIFNPQYYIYTTSQLSTWDPNFPTTHSNTPPAGKNYYLGYDYNGSNITGRYVCFIKNGNEYCLKEGQTATNKSIVDDAYNNTCTTNNGDYICTDGNLRSVIDSSDYIYIGVENGTNYPAHDCRVKSGDQYCNE